jgi:hypothetical protein
MHTLTASHRAIVAAALGLAVSLSLGACSPMVAGAPTGQVGCSLLFIYGDLVADNGRTALVTSPNYSPYWDHPVPLDWPDDWTIRPGDGGQLEVVDVGGTVRGRTGTFITLSAVNDPGGSGAWIRDGEMVVCPGQWPAPIPRPADWTT